ncbi:MAG: acetate--CoA ligase family protein [Deltaproteobacteria bacterium]|nr:acetate--CoA ligase family protein [Deltaproteobacteria bacterium]
MSSGKARSSQPAPNPRPDVQALLNPRNVVIVGATDKPGNWPQRCARNLARYGYAGAVYPLNPGREEVWGTRCYRSYAELPEPPDHLAVFVPAPFVEETLREGTAAGARSATVVSAGFGESPDPDALARGEALAATIAELGIAVSGPNCLGNFNGGARFVTMTDNRPQRTEPGPIAIVGQSGGLVMALKRTLEERGMDVGYIVTSGNEAGLKTGDYIEYFAADPQTRIIVSYLEAVREPEKFLAACRAAKAAGKPVIVVKLGTSDNGRAAALAHTGALAGSIAAFDAIAGAAGTVRVATLDDVVEMAEYLLHTRLPKGEGLGAITFSGGLRGVLLDQASANGLSFPPLAAKTENRLEKLLGVGTVVGNPLDSGFAALSSRETYIRCVEAMLDDPGVDTLLLQEELLRAPEGGNKEANMQAVNALAARARKPIAFVTMISHGLNDYARELRDGLRNVAFMQEADKSLRAVRSIISYALRANADTNPKRTAANAPPLAVRKLLERAGHGPGPTPLSEIDSKALLRAYGLRTPKERLARSAAEAVRIARDIGLPVVLKAAGAELTHKSDAGGVLLSNRTLSAVRQGYAVIMRNVARKAKGIAIDGVLVAEQVAGELELVIGAARDPEMGAMVMFGSGGVALELYRDVAFAAPTLDEVRADELITRTRAARLIDGYRGASALDRKALVKALMAVSRLACDLGDRLESIDVNPFVLRRRGGVALDALVVLAGAGRDNADS